jgi:serine phosphatase RsbU (regulator of sigma subunit)
VTYTVPDTAERRKALGFDQLSDPIRALAVTSARDSGDSRLTKPIIQVIGGRPGVTLYAPVYQPGFPLTTVAQRGVALRGFVTAGIVLSDLAARVRGLVPRDADVRVADSGQVLFGPQHQDDPVGSTIRVAGRPWMVSVEARRSSALLAALPVAGLGLVLAALVWLGASLAAGRERELEERRENAERTREQQREIAATLQRALLPRRLPSPPRIDVAARYRPGMEGTEVGGDFYDLFPTGDTWLAVVGDVCGKGAEAAALTALARHTLRAVANLGGPPTLLGRLNDAIRNDSGDMTFATVALCVLELESSTAGVPTTFATGGHPPPLIVHADGSVEPAQTTGPFLGVVEEPSFETWKTELEPGATVLLYTDGVLEARVEGDLFGEERLHDLLVDTAKLPLNDLLGRIEGAVVEFAGGHPQDDIALLALRVT